MKRRRVEQAREAAHMYLVRREGSAIMRKAGMHPALIHAWEKTGMLVGEDSPHTDEQRQEWNDAVDEWNALHPEQALEGDDETTQAD
jgi:hypothetical protein